MVPETPTPVALTDVYTATHGRVLMSGTQAMVRALTLQRARDAAAGLDTRGYVSGYRGSPLGGFDSELLTAQRKTGLDGIVFEAGLNEDLAATAIAGTQQIGAFGASVDGVFGLWYGKGPGVDRSGDALKHGNMSGSAAHGGVIAVFGDDHPGKSSTVAHQSDPAMAAHGIPVLYPANVGEIVEYALLGWAMSRFTGLWVGVKLVNETAEGTATVDIAAAARAPVLPDGPPGPPEGVHHRTGFDPAGDDARTIRFKLPRALAFARANGLDRVVVAAPAPALCVVSAGKAWADVRQALALLEVDDARAAALGLTLYKVGMISPLEPERLREAVAGAAEVLVVEEKRPFLEPQIAAALFNDAARPRLTGKLDADGELQLPSDVQLDPLAVALVLARALARHGRADAALAARAAVLQARAVDAAAVPPAEAARAPFFCSGCPHNRSTLVPEASVALGGIGCHGMAMGMDRRTLPPMQMGAEGANWIGAARFVRTPHVFQNLGDGTYAHSGTLAVRAAVNAGVNITYKILLNDAVAMTGGQSVEGALGAGEIARQMQAEGVRQVVVVSDDPEALAPGLPAGTAARPRTDLDAVQRELRAVPGTTVLIYAQVCAAEKRRRRKRGKLADPARRIVINEAVCESCGDCTAKSNCVSVVPVETPLGRKRQIDQSSCNKDYSCTEGFCPSFVSVTPTAPAAARAAAPAVPPDLLANLPDPAPAPPYAAVLVTGIGGTGVTTVAAILAMAAHIEGRSAQAYNMTGLAQKGGSVTSHLKIGPAGTDPGAARIGAGEASAIIGCDLVVTGGRECLAAIDPARTRVVLDTHATPTAAFQRDTDYVLPASAIERAIAARTADAAHLFALDMTRIALALFGESIAANIMLAGAAAQRGLLPLAPASIEAAIHLNGTAATRNIAAFRAGRAAAYDPARLAALAAPPPAPLPATLEAIVAHRRALLTAWGGTSVADGYETFVARVTAAEAAAVPGADAIARAVAHSLARLIAYKDEYEVARLHTQADFHARLTAEHGARPRLQFHMAPPLFAPRDPVTGHPRKIALGPWLLPVLRLLARARPLRGTPLDPFGYSRERRTERALPAEYRADIERALARLTPETHARVAALAAWPDRARGFGHVKAANLATARTARNALLAALEAAPPGLLAQPALAPRVPVPA